MHTLSDFLPAAATLFIYFTIGFTLGWVPAALFALIALIASGLIITSIHFNK